MASSPALPSSPPQGHHKTATSALTLGALGVVFGDIGTSPLYAFKECLSPEHGVLIDRGAVLGLLSLVFWGLMLVVTLKYVVFVLRADHDGEGGILALAGLAKHALEAGSRARPWLFRSVSLMGLVGAAMFYGDSLITPAISVLSAVEGIEVATPHLRHWVVPITLAVLVALFAVQRYGTASVGRIFGPVMVLWFLTLAVSGLAQVLQHPGILEALDPRWALSFMRHHAPQAIGVLGAVFLAFTGGEALYADMGHFGARPIRLAWSFIALPALTLNYFGQGALVLHDAGAAANPFFHLFPDWATVPMVVLAACATVIASQAVISGAYSMTAHAMRMGYLPRMRIVQTSGDAIGQIYLPGVNWVLMAGVLALVLAFRSSGALAAAYGIAVSVTMLATTLLTGIVAWRLWRWNGLAVATGVALFALVDLVFIGANSVKIADGGWLTLVVAALAIFVFVTWSRGRRVAEAAAAEERFPLAPFIESLTQYGMPHRVKGTAVFLTADADSVPHALLHNLKHNQVLHERVVVMAVHAAPVPRVDAGRRLEAQDLGSGVWKVNVSHGFTETPDVPEYLRLLAYRQGLQIEAMATSFFTSRASVGTGRLDGLNALQKTVFAWMQRNAARAPDYFGLPGNRLIEIGRRAT
ncbi:potassium transporter Kup [Xylophilus rhododendri]|uniref:Probable potassium transport system protein Kup n=1 Tax=Xylophilus rhododendri TaxID=2697032 RepID=A0A857J0E9_9BURK|nr:potassium transporter Kup [Xylophilus rhododendri]QHI97344.1 potassium transporter Kup [Xylophilus rhododendri]